MGAFLLRGNMKKVLFCLLFLVSCGDLPPSQPSRPSIPIGTNKVLNALLKPTEAKDSDWTTAVSRVVFKNAPTGFVIKGNLCDFVGEAKMLLPITITNPSAKEYAYGVYYDAIVDLTNENCKEAIYGWLELNESYTKHGINIQIKPLSQMAPTAPTVPLFVQLEPYAFIKGINKGKYLNEEEKALQALELLKSHRLQPIKSWVATNSSYTGSYNFKQYVHDFSLGPVNVPTDDAVLNFQSKLYKPWFYVMDEPGASYKDQLQLDLNKLKQKFPAVSRMVTTTKSYPVSGIDIYCPVFQQIGDRTKYDRLWGYVSCMSHGCGDNRDWLQNVNSFSHKEFPRSGEPDLVIDAPAADLFAFYLIAIKLKLEAILYYDSITQWMLAQKGIDVYKDMYNFGGNGDGTLLYPDYNTKQALPSLRLKYLREASYLADAVSLSNSADLLTNIVSPTEWSIPLTLRDQVYSRLEN